MRATIVMKHVWTLVDDTWRCTHHIAVWLITGGEGRGRSGEENADRGGCWWGGLKERSHSEDGRIILKWILKKLGKVWPAFLWLWTGGKQRDSVSMVTDIILHIMQGIYYLKNYSLLGEHSARGSHLSELRYVQWRQFSVIAAGRRDGLELFG